jgi:hypothetical protein
MHILITGDSWSQGEWDGYPTHYHVSHQGITEYFKNNGISVTNVGKGGNTNLDSLISAQSNLTNDYTDLIFFFTDPLRQTTLSEIKTYLPLEIINSHTEFVFNSLLHIKTLFPNLRITMIGGCAKIPFINNSIDFNIPSITELLCPSYTDSCYMLSDEWEKPFRENNFTFSIEQKQQWTEIIDLASKKFFIWKQNPELFWPDGLHANRHAHYQLYTHIIKLWGEAGNRTLPTCFTDRYATITSATP